MRPWTEEDLERLRALARQGKSARMIAAEMDRTHAAVSSRALREGIKLKHARKHYLPWAPETVAMLRRLREEGRTVPEISRIMKRTEASIRSRLDSLGISRTVQPGGERKTPGTSIRNCMTCQVEFLSEGAHNRMCARCRRRSEDET